MCGLAGWRLTCQYLPATCYPFTLYTATAQAREAALHRGLEMPIQEQGQVAEFLSAHLIADPPRYARLRAGRARRTSDTIWRRDLPGADVRALAREVVERHAGIGRTDKAWLEIVEKSARFPVIDTLPLGTPPEESADDDGPDVDEMSRGELVTALVSAVLASNKQVSEDNASLRDALTRKDDQLIGVFQRSQDLAMQAAKDSVLLRMHEEGVFSNDHGTNWTDRVQALLPLVAAASPHIAAAFAGATRGAAPAPPPPVDATTLDPATRVEALLLQIETALADPACLREACAPDRIIRLHAIAAQVMAAASGSAGA